MDRNEDAVKHFSVYVDGQRLAESAVEMTKNLKPNWPEDEIQVKTFTDGITNRLVGCHLIGNPDDVVLIRVYGEKTELFIDRLVEIRNMKLMHQAGLSPPLYGSFRNGICYGFTPGQVLDLDMVRNVTISRLIATKLADMHSVVSDDLTGAEDTSSALQKAHSKKNVLEKPMLFRILRRYLELLPRALRDSRQNERFQKNVPSKEDLEREVNFLQEQLSLVDSPIVFCHNDLLLKNIIYHKNPSAEESVTFIDFEYADFNYQAFDIANHFCEFAGVDNFDPSLYPNKEFQMVWLEHYLRRRRELQFAESNVIGSQTTVESDLSIEDEAHNLYFQVRKFTLAAHMFWGIWALLQSEHSTIKFDFLGYAIKRFDEYFAKKTSNLNGHH